MFVTLTFICVCAASDQSAELAPLLRVGQVIDFKVERHQLYYFGDAKEPRYDVTTAGAGRIELLEDDGVPFIGFVYDDATYKRLLESAKDGKTPERRFFSRARSDGTFESRLRPYGHDSFWATEAFDALRDPRPNRPVEIGEEWRAAFRENPVSGFTWMFAGHDESGRPLIDRRLVFSPARGGTNLTESVEETLLTLEPHTRRPIRRESEKSDTLVNSRFGMPTRVDRVFVSTTVIYEEVKPGSGEPVEIAPLLPVTERQIVDD